MARHLALVQHTNQLLTESLLEKSSNDFQFASFYSIKWYLSASFQHDVLEISFRDKRQIFFDMCITCMYNICTFYCKNVDLVSVQFTFFFPYQNSTILFYYLVKFSSWYKGLTINIIHYSTGSGQWPFSLRSFVLEYLISDWMVATSISWSFGKLSFLVILCFWSPIHYRKLPCSVRSKLLRWIFFG